MVVEFVDGANLYEHIAADRISDWLLAVGSEDAQYRADTVTSFIENGYDMPMAWSALVRSELLEINVGAGYIAGAIAHLQRAMAQHCGLAFVRVMQGSVRTDAEVAAGILKAKHSPEAPGVTVDSDFAPAQDPWLVWMQNMAGWLRPLNNSMASAVTQFKVNFAVSPDELSVPFGNPKAIALGTVLRGKCGFGEVHMVVLGEILEGDDGLEIIQSITATAFADLADALVKQWMEPVLVVEPYLVEAAVMEWRKQQDRLRKLGRFIVDDPTVSL